jgi:hypothetical protein
MGQRDGIRHRVPMRPSLFWRDCAMLNRSSTRAVSAPRPDPARRRPSRHRIVALATMLLAAAGAQAQEGLLIEPIKRGAGTLLWFGDHYLTGPGFGDGSLSGGLRLTSGLTLGSRAEARALPPPRLLGGLSAGLRHGDDIAPGLAARDGERIALPYVGLGYTTLSVRGGWGVSADIGLGGMRPGERLRLGTSGTSAAQVEDILNRLRLAPVLQLGVSYTF